MTKKYTNQSSQPLVSILVPTYNREAYIADCIDSALNQTYSNIEVVVVDNCSTDRTFQICLEFQAKDLRVKVFQNSQNIGPVRNWQKCAEKAEGLYVKVLFSDDELLPTCIEELVQSIESNHAVGIAYCAALIGPNREIARTYYKSLQTELLTSVKYAERMLVARAPYSPCASLMRRESFVRNLHTNFDTAQPHPYDRHGAGPDCMVQLLTADQFEHVAHINKPLVYFRSHAGSFTAENLNNQVHSAYLACLSLYAKNKLSRSTFLGFLFLTWLDSIRRGRWVSPKSYFQAHEGKGSLLEYLSSPFLAIPLLSARLKRYKELRAANANLKR